MFHPEGHPMERGWVGRIDGERVVHLAAQTLQSFFTGGGTAREHAEYPLGEACLLAPVLHPPSVRVFEGQDAFAFANPAAIVGPSCEIVPGAPMDDQAALVLVPRVAGVIGGEGALAGFTILAEWRDPGRTPPKDRDFALGLGPLVLTADAFADDVEVAVRVDGAERHRARCNGFEWEAARSLAAERTRLLPGDLLAGPAQGLVEGIRPGSGVEVEVGAIGVLEQRVAG
jgi:hypothetical protein